MLKHRFFSVGLELNLGIEPRYPRALLRSAYGLIDKVKVISGEWISREQLNGAQHRPRSIPL